MAEVFGVISLLSSLVELSSVVLVAPFEAAEDAFFCLRTYGPVGLFVALFGNRSVWQLQAEVITLEDDNIAFSFKRSAQDECNIVAIAVSKPERPCQIKKGSHAHWLEGINCGANCHHIILPWRT